MLQIGEKINQVNNYEFSGTTGSAGWLEGGTRGKRSGTASGEGGLGLPRPTSRERTAWEEAAHLPSEVPTSSMAGYGPFRCPRHRNGERF